MMFCYRSQPKCISGEFRGPALEDYLRTLCRSQRPSSVMLSPGRFFPCHFYLLDWTKGGTNVDKWHTLYRILETRIIDIENDDLLELLCFLFFYSSTRNKKGG